MYKLEDIRDIHLELTSKCQARCPMCPRRINGGILNPLIALKEITLDQFKEWFSVSLIQQLDSLFMCGNLGDPIIAQDCLEIIQHIRETNPSIQLSMHTNGSARSIQWWEQLSYTRTRVVFGIDGLADTHSLYRIDTNYNKIIENARAFIESGGVAEWHMLAFKHNEHQIEDCRTLSQQLGFKKFSLKHTSRFVEDKFHVLNEQGQTTHILYPTDYSTNIVSLVRQNFLSKEINCKAKKNKQIYISSDGTVVPCCWLDLNWQVPKQSNRIDYMDNIEVFPNLNNSSLLSIFESGYFNKIETTPLIECSRQCGKYDKLGEQFVN
jgi:MoaA/NifB/PqqE/SkfB family radical SAM enzyme